MHGSPTPAQSDFPADMEEVKSICSLIQAGRITWDDLVALDTMGPVPHAPDWSRSPHEQRLVSTLRDQLYAKNGGRTEFASVVNTLITHLFDRSLSLLPESFKERVRKAKERKA